MSHRIYTTEGFILKSANYGEANKFFFIFTKDFGLIRAAAQSVRHLQSKLRYQLQDFSWGRISLVRGREVWRITSAEKIHSLITSSEKSLDKKISEKFLLLARIFSLLLRLLSGEEKNDLLFTFMTAGFIFLKDEELSNIELASFECIIALRILSALGYLRRVGQFEQFIVSPDFNLALLKAMSPLRTMAIWEINKALKETHL